MGNSIEICMGSSCFARGNRENLEWIEAHLQKKGLTADVLLSGCRCKKACGQGPNIELNETLFHGVDAGTLQDLLNLEFSGEKPEVNP